MIDNPKVTVTVQPRREGMTEQQICDFSEQAARQRPSVTDTDRYKALKAGKDAGAWRSRVFLRTASTRTR